MHLLLVDLGFDLGCRTDILRNLRASFGAEYRIDTDFERRLGNKFRAERPALNALLSTPEGAEHTLDAGFEQLLAMRSQKVTVIAAELAARERKGRLTIPVRDFAASIVHMHEASAPASPSSWSGKRNFAG